MNRCLVTGASGFIGGHLCRHLLAGGREVRGFSRSAPRRAPGHIQGDMLDRDALARACEGVDTVFHLAGAAGTADRQNQTALRVNVEGASNLLAAARDAGVRRLVFVSSALAAELDGNDSDQRVGDYARSKWQAERLVLAANGSDGLLTTVLRPAPVYGVGMKSGLARMIRLIHTRRLPPLPRLDHGLSLVGVEDVCRAAMLAAENPAAAGRCWLLTDLERYTANDIESAVRRAMGRGSPRWHTPAVVFFAAAAVLQFGRLMGWKSAESGLQTWRNLTRERIWPAAEIYQSLDFRPVGTLYAQLPEIIRELTGKQAAKQDGQ